MMRKGIVLRCIYELENHNTVYRVHSSATVIADGHIQHNSVLYPWRQQRDDSRLLHSTRGSQRNLPIAVRSQRQP